MKKLRAIKKAVTVAGGRGALADKLAPIVKIDRKLLMFRIQKWESNGIPARFIIPVETVSGVSRHDLDPQIYPR